MRGFFELLKRFHTDERGVFAVIFGLMAIVLIAMAGAVVDYTSIEQARTRAQTALDAAALGLQPDVFDTPTPTDQSFIDKAQLLLEERLGDNSITPIVEDAEINVRDGTLELTASINVPTAFVALIGIAHVRAHLVSEATRKRLNLEVVMVLDNSGSMSSSSRMVKLKEAAISATKIMFDDEETQPNVFVGIVPFTQFVNVGTANKTASWMSQTGASSFSHLNFDNDDNEDTEFKVDDDNDPSTAAVWATVDRWALFDAANNESWSGCVEARFTPYDTDDTEPDDATPDTMFQPVFAPDAPTVSNYISNDNPAACYARGSCNWVYVRRGCNSSGSTCTGTTTTTATYTARYGEITTSIRTSPATTPVDVCNCTTLPTDANRITSNSNNTTSTGSGTNRTRTQTWKCTYTFDIGASYANLSANELQQRLCKYAGASFSGTGPNTANCPAAEILPMTNVRATIDARITAMVADGSTNIAQGAIWGFHAISPTEPLTEGREYDEATSKVLIIMTDGQNNPDYAPYPPATDSRIVGNNSWSAWGYRINKRLLTESTTPKDSLATEAEVIAEIDRRTVESCDNAKAAGIKVYTIGLTAPTALKPILRSCASPTEDLGGPNEIIYSHFPATSAELVGVFEEIAGQLSLLRLAK